MLSCRNEDVYNSVQQNKEYASKSPWKEDQVYIKNVKSVFEKYANQGYFENKYGQVYWDYAMSFGKFDESFLVVPIVKKNKVATVMKVIRNNDRIFLKELKDSNLISFFDDLINRKLEKFAEEKIISTEKSPNETASKIAVSYYICSSRTIEVGCFEQETNCSPAIRTVNSCSWINIGGNYFMEIDQPTDGGGGSGGGSSGGGEGLPYPDQNTDPCAKAKIGVNNANTTLSDARIKTDFTDKMKNIAASSTNSETGMTIGKDSNGNIKVTEPITVTGTAGQVPAAPAGYNAIADGHNHNYSNPPSPGDLWTMMENLVNNPYFETRYIFGQDGSIYALTVNDRQAAIDFLAAHPRSEYLKPNSGDFIQSSTLFNDFDFVKNKFLNILPTNNEATTAAMAYIMDKYGTGISLSKSDGTKLQSVNAQQNPDGTYSTSICN